MIRTLVTGCTLLPMIPVARTSSPVSSRVSRTAASAGDSPGSIFPPGNVHGGAPSLRRPTSTPRRLVTTATATSGRPSVLASSVTSSILAWCQQGRSARQERFTRSYYAVSLQCGHQTAGEPMSMLGINAATTQSVTGKGADGKGKASGSSAEGPPPPTPGSLDMQSDNGNLQPPNPNATLPERKPHQPPQIPILRATEATKLPDLERDAARAERRDPAHQPDRSDGSILREREELRRQL